ncbi:hypothetical protein ACH5RR_035402 [Cinchona calisaya]|uniref:Integral membrane family protein n=1 Tax=Cinchona calisaya TaxID=153742 RepID=A0ABD2Y0E2_9GENT
MYSCTSSSSSCLSASLLLGVPPPKRLLLNYNNNHAIELRLRLSHRRSPKCQAVGERRSSSSSSSQEKSPSSEEQVVVYQGVYGPWTIQPSDVQEVILYRSGLVTTAASFVLASSTLFLPHDSPLCEFINTNLDLLYTLGACGLGLSLYLIHIYVTQIKRTLQALWLLGAFGSFATYATLAQPAAKHLVHYVVTQNPTAIWFVGPLFAALTGLVFKEGLCYGKLEAAILTFVVPTLLLGHLTGLMDDGVKVTLLGVWMALFVVFAGRKFFQPIKDDIGDKSIFMFNALPEEEKKALVNKLEQQMK